MSTELIRVYFRHELCGSRTGRFTEPLKNKHRSALKRREKREMVFLMPASDESSRALDESKVENELESRRYMHNGRTYGQLFIQLISSFERSLINSRDGSREQESRSINRSMYLQFEESETKNIVRQLQKTIMEYLEILEEQKDVRFQRLQQSGFARSQKKNSICESMKGESFNATNWTTVNYMNLLEFIAPIGYVNQKNNLDKLFAA